MTNSDRNDARARKARTTKPETAAPEEPPLKPESEMVAGKNYPHQIRERKLKYNPADRRTPQGGGPD